MPAFPDHFVLQIDPSLLIAAVIVIAVGHGMPALRGIAAERVEVMRCRRRSTDRCGNGDTPADDQRMGQLAGEIGAQAVIGRPASSEPREPL
jgi:hypothetical protein